ncbi:MAG TPA: hypothetical protein VFX89_01270 [Gammaproteobacteria bacterium]|nr:hypothetical protein [Gammaproteobacteria bacterium]
MRVQVHPAVFLASAVAVSAAWLWLRPVAETAAPVIQSSTPRAPRPADTRPSVQVDAAVLERYEGRYEVEGFAIAVSVDGQRLLVRGDDGMRIGLRAASETEFFFEDFPGELTFAAGEPSPGFVADLPGGRFRGKRVGD